MEGGEDLITTQTTLSKKPWNPIADTSCVCAPGEATFQEAPKECTGRAYEKKSPSEMSSKQDLQNNKFNAGKVKSDCGKPVPQMGELILRN